jgi:hypothetical protein
MVRRCVDRRVGGSESQRVGESEGRRVRGSESQRVGESEGRMVVAYGLNRSRVCLVRMICIQIHFLASQWSLTDSSTSKVGISDTRSLPPSLAATVLWQWVARPDSEILSEV